MLHTDALTAFSRRRFLIATSSAAGGLAIGVILPAVADAAALAPQPWDKAAPGDAAEANAWILIEPDGSVVIRVAQSDGRRRLHIDAHDRRRGAGLRLDEGARRIRVGESQPARGQYLS